MGVAVLVPIAGVVFVLQVEIFVAGGVVTVGVVVGRAVPLLMAVSLLLALVWSREALMQVLGQLLVASSVEVPAAA